MIYFSVVQTVAILWRKGEGIQQNEVQSIKTEG